jgi:type IV pilus assembly protein PilP
MGSFSIMRATRSLFGWPGGLALLALALMGPSAYAQAATASPLKTQETAKTTSGAPQGYTYNPAGRRDPFVSLTRRGSDPRASAANRPEGLPGLLASEVTVKGIVHNRGTYLAMLQGPDNKTYIVRSGDRLFDATVKAVTADAVVFVQEVTDPLSLVKQREIRRPLRPTEEGK